MQYAIESRELTEQPTAARRATLTAEQVPQWLAEAYAGVGEYLNRTGAMMAGLPYSRLDFHDERIDVEAGFPVIQPIVGDSSTHPSTLPGGPAAVTTHYGPYEAVDQAYEAIQAWLHDRGLRPNGGHWEVYYSDPTEEPDSAKWRTDLFAPYTRDQ